jgi:para-nitrobenzyl esterase
MAKSNSGNLDRRQALLLPAAGLGAAMAIPAQAGKTKSQSSGSCSTPRSAVAKTQNGKVRGYVADGVLTFKGIPYGQNTAGENRWLSAKPPKPGRTNIRPLSTAPTARSVSMTSPRQSSRSSTTGPTAT